MSEKERVISNPQLLADPRVNKFNPFQPQYRNKMPRGGKTGGKLASSRSTSVYHRSSSVASSSRNQDLSGSVASVLAELQSLLVQTQVGGHYLE